MYGDPMEVLAAKQAREKRQAQQQQKRPTLALKREPKLERVKRWSAAREAAEALFDVPVPPRPIRES
jgi:hypothetical protein